MDSLARFLAVIIYLLLWLVIGFIISVIWFYISHNWIFNHKKLILFACDLGLDKQNK